MVEENKDCPVCDGTREVEGTTFHRDDAGVIQVEGTGEYRPCPECCDTED